MKFCCLLVSLLFLLFSGPVRGNSGFDVRAFHLDFRTEVMTVEAMKALVDHIAAQGMNTIVVEWEATFPFDKHATLCNENAFSKEQVEEFIAYCKSRSIDVIPLQNCFGHCEYILRHDRYHALREDTKDPSQVCPLEITEAKAVFSEIFAEVAALHPSQYFHIGADETYLLGQCRECRKVAAEQGKSRLFVDYVKAMSEIVIAQGKTPVIWADIILMHPEALDELPKELVFVDWNYGWEPDKFGKLENLFARGVKLWGAPSLRSGPDNIYLTQWMKHFDNIAVYVDFARRHGYAGLIQTSWSTSGTYGYHYDNGYEVINMQPVRLVYPMAAFRVLVDAYCEAVTSPEPFIPEVFVRRYAATKLGLDCAGAGVLWRYFSMPQEPVKLTASGARDAKGRPVDELLVECGSMRNELAGLKPSCGKEQTAHYLLMLDIRIHYLKFKVLEARYQSASYDRSKAAGLLRELKILLDESSALDKRFSVLNRGYLKESEIVYINRMRSEKMRSVYQRITTNR